MATLTIGADDFDVDGPVPAEAWFKFRRYRLDRRGPRLGSELAWTVTLDEGGNATTELPADQAGNALVITSSYPGFTQVTVAGYPEDVGTLARLLAYEVDPTTLRQSSGAAAAWSLIVGRVEALVTTGVAHVAAAAASAAEAARSALGAADSASSSGTSAFNAGKSAATALGHANDSAASAASSAGSAAEAIGVANSSVVDGFLRAVDEQVRLIFRRKNNTEFDVGDIRGPQGIPGAGVPWGGTLAALDLNTVVTPGVYRQPNGASARLDRNYPYEGNSGVLEVYDVNSGAGPLFQRYSTVGGASGDVRGFYIRRRTNSTTWTAWQYVARQRVATDAGRAIYTWDDVNGRDQLIYGDTGFRNIKDAIPLGPVLTALSIAYMSRYGSFVELQLSGVTKTAGAVTINGVFPPGFRPPTTNASATGHDSGGNRLDVTAIGNGQLLIRGATPVTNGGVTLSFRTIDAWPTTLPGAAAGTIPNL